ncbi:molybdate ABC transporter substrate-binding protein [Methylomonas koyamae]|uniref:Molybdate ABC transporter substrate-binding protein n=1 Tax=Methylomonas koyamae TaxID=702114 RepID=A0A291IJQ1_9GAMM|nr:molybdate ABC transporter substrate-binding protein [Methylomonas koyamae]ATG90411.1 molybdate ABC transporter substrate-binding protein [Methylomonas koyamae]OAI24628.1 molybdate ABC transporter substrate-binding protein [Methylomonas koyamae]
MAFTGNRRLLVIVGLFVASQAANAATALAAVAANFTKPMTEIAEAFEKSTGHTAKLSFGSSGKFVAQFENGAPFEVFLSADDKSPAKLEESGLAVAGSRFTYAIGKLVLWSANADLVDSQGQVLNSGNFKHLALADPKLAPYGAAAVETLKNLGLLEKLAPLFVQGENIAQTHQFVSSGNAELGFVALSQVIENGKIGSGSGWTVPAKLYQPILQDAVLLKNGAENPAAQALLEFLKSDQALAIIEKYGYALPPAK